MLFYNRKGKTKQSPDADSASLKQCASSQDDKNKVYFEIGPRYRFSAYHRKSACMLYLRILVSIGHWKQCPKIEIATTKQVNMYHVIISLFPFQQVHKPDKKGLCACLCALQVKTYRQAKTLE
jgi:hypothetical protein